MAWSAAHRSGSASRSVVALSAPAGRRCATNADGARGELRQRHRVIRAASGARGTPGALPALALANGSVASADRGCLAARRTLLRPPAPRAVRTQAQRAGFLTDHCGVRSAGSLRWRRAEPPERAAACPAAAATSSQQRPGRIRLVGSARCALLERLAASHQTSRAAAALHGSTASSAASTMPALGFELERCVGVTVPALPRAGEAVVCLFAAITHGNQRDEQANRDGRAIAMARCVAT